MPVMKIKVTAALRVVSEIAALAARQRERIARVILQQVIAFEIGGNGPGSLRRGGKDASHSLIIAGVIAAWRSAGSPANCSGSSRMDFQIGYRYELHLRRRLPALPPARLRFRPIVTPIAAAQPSLEGAMKNLRFRGIGPATMGGRVDDVAVVESDPRIMYIGSAAGGLFKTVNGGQSWQPLFDDQPNSSIGDIAIAPSNPAIVYVGTGEANNRQSSSWGDGVYKSMDAGATWKHIGLEKTHHIGRIVVNPTDPNIVYVAALGDLWGPNEERGVYMSSDGGAHWTQALKINEDTGVSDIAIDPQSPNILYAAAYQRRRTVFGYNGGGPGSGIYRSTDAGQTWTKLGGQGATLGRGLPATGDMGRIALEVYRKNSNVVYAEVEHATLGGVLPLRR